MRIRCALPALLLLATACERITAPRTAASLRVNPDSINVRLDSAVQLSVAVVDLNGDSLNIPVTWLSLDTTVVTVSAGLVTARNVGQTELVVAADTQVVRVPVRVTIKLSMVVAGDYSTCGLDESKRPLCWGNGSVGYPRRSVAGPLQLASVEPAGAGVCGLTSVGEAHCFSWTGGVDSVVPGTHAFSSLTHAGAGPLWCGLAGGALLCWGRTYYDVVPGVTNASTVPTPTDAAPGRSFTQAAGGWGHVCALDAGGAPWCWGLATYGEAGDSASDINGCSSDGPCVDHPVQVAGAPVLVSITSGGFHSCGLTASGDAWCWGDNEVGQLGDTAVSACFESRIYQGYPCSQAPRLVQGGHHFTAISAGTYHTCALEADGGAWCWGYNAGALGDGTDSDGGYHVRAVTGGLRFSSIRAGYDNTCGMATDGRAYCWGTDTFNNLGNGPQQLDRRLAPSAVLFQP